MNVGFVSFWCNRGQAAVTRQIRSIFDQAGHATFVLARPTQPAAPVPNFIDRRSEWAAPRVTEASAYDIPVEEYVTWAKACRLDVLFCDTNWNLDGIAAVRALGVRTIGRFVWESFSPKRLHDVRQAYDVVYSLTRCEQQRYKALSLDSPYVPWGIHPTLLGHIETRPSDAIHFIFHGGKLGLRKPVRKTVEAFKAVGSRDIRLIIKSQAISRNAESFYADDDPRISFICDDMPANEYARLFAGCHVCLAPSRWEGLGVHLYEAMAYGMPVVATDIPPINEVVMNGVSGLLCRTTLLRHMESGIPVFDPDPEHLRQCIAEIAEPACLEQLTEGVRRRRNAFSWTTTARHFLALAVAEATAVP